MSSSTNRITSIGSTNFTYESSGDLTSDGTYSPSYDAEGHITSVAGVTYSYDGDGNRVQKSSGTLYWYGTGSDALDETDAGGNLTNEYIFFGGKRIARRDSSSNVFYYFADNLGTSRAILQAGQTNPCYDQDFYPYGREVPHGSEIPAFFNTCPQNYKFTGKERDSESGLDNFGARYDSSQYGRFMTPDPSGIWLANLWDPQQLNLYSYVRNNPLSFIDPDGLDCVYLNDQGTGIDDNGVDHNSNQGECWNHGGYWANGTVANSNSSIITDPNSNTIGIYSTDSNGDTGFSIAGQGWTQNPGSWSVNMMYSPSPQGPDLTPPTDQQKLTAVKVSGMEAAHGMSCAGRAAVANTIPFGGHLVGMGDAKSDATDAAEAVALHPFATAKALNRIEMPNIGEAVVSTAKVRGVAKALKAYKAVSPAVDAYNFSQDMAACYDNPDN